MYEQVGNCKILQPHFMTKQEKQTLLNEQMHYLHSNPLKKLKVSNSLLYERAKIGHGSSYSGMVSW